VCRGLALLVLGGMVVVGCRGPVTSGCDGRELAGADFGDFRKVPSPRIGSIPFPSLVTLFEVGDPAKLGRHVYRRGAAFEGVGESGRGIVYTRRAGLIDLAHVRNTVDYAAHIHARVRHALRMGEGCVRFRLAEPSVYTVEIDYPEGWWGLTDEARLAQADVLAVRASEVLALDSMTWHEALTWYGYKSAVVVSERPSAFTYDDPVSHAVGAVVAGRVLGAMRDGNEGSTGARLFGELVTSELEVVLEELGAVGPVETLAAVESVRGVWWEGDLVRRRQVQGGDGPITPWLVPGGGSDDSPVVFRFPGLSRLSESGTCPTLRARIEPAVLEEAAILRALGESLGLETMPESVGVEDELPVLLDRIREEMVTEFGPGVLSP